jgi:purine-binding chemotaxis protein CheW
MTVNSNEVVSAADTHGGKSTGELIQLVSFNLAGEEYGVDILKVQEINRMLQITRVPKAPEFVEGVINLRGKVIPIISLRRKFGLESREFDKKTRIVVVDIEGRILGVVVDAVSEVLRLPVDTIEPPPPVVSGKDVRYIRGVGKVGSKLLILLDLTKLLTDAEKEILDKSHTGDAETGTAVA